MQPANLSRIGGLVALVALLVLPLASCGEGQITGPELFRMEGAELHKLLVAVAGISAALTIFYVSRNAQLGLGAAGLISMLISAWMVIGDDSADTQVQIGAWVAVLGFVLVLVAGYMQPAAPARRDAGPSSRPRRKRTR